MSRSTTVIAVQPHGSTESGSLLGALVETTKPRITRLVTITAAVGFAMVALGKPPQAWGALALTAIGCIVGTALAAAGANALNQWFEARRDALMARTAERPLPDRRAPASTVYAFGLTLSVLGVGVLAATAGLMPALLGLTCIVVYVLIYTPLKPVSAWSTLVGAIPGALPPLIGSTAAADGRGLEVLLDPLGLSLFALMMVWQIPHFLAIAWLYRDDYARGGHRMLPVLDVGGSRTAFTVLLTSALLMPATLWPAWAGGALLGAPYVAMAGLTGVAFMALAVRLARRRTREAARTLFIASIIHLPLLLIAMVGEAFVRVLLT